MKRILAVSTVSLFLACTGGTGPDDGSSSSSSSSGGAASNTFRRPSSSRASSGNGGGTSSASAGSSSGATGPASSTATSRATPSSSRPASSSTGAVSAATPSSAAGVSSSAGPAPSSARASSSSSGNRSSSDTRPSSTSTASSDGTVIFAAGGGTGLYVGEFHGSGWTTTTVSDATNDAPSVVLTDAANGLVVFRSTTGGQLRFSAWTPAAWGTPQAVIGSAITTAAPPHAVTSGPGTVSVTFLGDDRNHYFAQWWGGGWHPASPPADAVTGAVPQPGWLAPASITALSSQDVVVAYVGRDTVAGRDDLYDQSRVGTSWSSPHGRGLLVAPSMIPAACTLPGGTDVLLVYRETSSRPIFTARIGGTWSDPAQVDPNSYTNDSPSLACIPGGAVLVFRGTDTHAYFARYAVAGGTWTTPAPLLASGNPATISTPTLAPGVMGDDAELALVDSTGAVQHGRLRGTTWTLAGVGGSGLAQVAIASSP